MLLIDAMFGVPFVPLKNGDVEKMYVTDLDKKIVRQLELQKDGSEARNLKVWDVNHI